MFHIVEDNTRFEAELKIKIYNPDGSFKWEKMNGEIIHVESVLKNISQILGYDEIKREATIEQTFTFVSSKKV